MKKHKMLDVVNVFIRAAVTIVATINSTLLWWGLRLLPNPPFMDVLRTVSWTVIGAAFCYLLIDKICELMGVK